MPQSAAASISIVLVRDGAMAPGDDVAMTLRHGGLDSVELSKSIRTGSRFDPELVLIDARRTMTSAIDVCDRMRALTEAPILLVGPPGATEAGVLQAFGVGADDFLPAPVGARVLTAKARGMVEQTRRWRKARRNAVLAGTGLRGRYEVVEELGRGGMGVVYLVQDVVDGTRRALKVLGETDLDPAARERFEREIGVLGSLAHPNIVAIHEACGQGPTPCYVMEHLGAGSLRDRLEREGPMEPIAALELLAELADAIHYAHGRRILHRDLKTENVLFDERGGPVITDFGLALDMRKSRITGTGYTVGTLRSMPPEQLVGSGPVDARCDVYSLGVVLFEALTGRAPFDDSPGGSVVAEIVKGMVPSPRKFDRTLPVQAVAVCRQALSRDRDHRHATAELLARHARLAARGIRIATRARRGAWWRALRGLARRAAGSA